jgi:hypothetical protein
MGCGAASRAQKWLSIGLFAGIGIAALLLWRKESGRHGNNPVTETKIDEALEMTFPASDPPVYCI